MRASSPLFLLLTCACAHALVHFVPKNGSELTPFQTKCVLDLEKYSSQGETVSGNRVAESKSLCQKDTSSKIYENSVLVYDDYFPSGDAAVCDGLAGAIDSNFIEWFDIWEKAQVKAVLQFNKIINEPGLQIKRNSGPPKSNITYMILSCADPQNISDGEFKAYFGSGAEYSLHGVISENDWVALFEGALYTTLFQRILPTLHSITCASAAYMLLVLLASPQIKNDGGHKTVCIAMLYGILLVGIPSAYLFFVAGFYSTGNITNNVQNFFVLNLLFTSVGISLLLGVFWEHIRSQFVRKVASLGNSDDKKFFVKHKRSVLLFGMAFPLLDVAAGLSIANQIPYIEEIVGGLSTVSVFSLGCVYMRESFSFWRLHKNLKKNLPPNHAGLERMLKLSYLFALSASIQILYAICFFLFTSVQDQVYTPQGWITFWGFAHYFRWSVNATHALVCWEELPLLIGKIRRFPRLTSIIRRSSQVYSANTESSNRESAHSASSSHVNTK